MSEWIKSVLMKPLNYSLEKINKATTNLISIIFNLYGKRILKTNQDQIIKFHECNSDVNYFHLHELEIKQTNQFIGTNHFSIDSGTVNGMVVAVPWSSIFTNSIQLKIDDVELFTSIVIENESVYYSFMNVNQSYGNLDMNDDENL